MELIFPSHMVWWLSAIYIPITVTLFTLFLRIKRETNEAIDDLQKLIHTRHSQLRDSLAAYKLEVAKSYASVTDVREVEARLVAHLLRIESKLDRRTEKDIH
jgi:hypothetical protein